MMLRVPISPLHTETLYVCIYEGVELTIIKSKGARQDVGWILIFQSTYVQKVPCSADMKTV